MPYAFSYFSWGIPLLQPKTRFGFIFEVGIPPSEKQHFSTFQIPLTVFFNIEKY